MRILLETLLGIIIFMVAVLFLFIGVLAGSMLCLWIVEAMG